MIKLLTSIYLTSVTTILPVNPDKVCESGKLNHSQILSQVQTKENGWDEGYIVLNGEDFTKFIELWNRSFPSRAPAADTLIIFISEANNNSLLILTNDDCFVGSLQFPLPLTKSLLRNAIGMRVND